MSRLVPKTRCFVEDDAANVQVRMCVWYFSISSYRVGHCARAAGHRRERGQAHADAGFFRTLNFVNAATGWGIAPVLRDTAASVGKRTPTLGFSGP